MGLVANLVKNSNPYLYNYFFNMFHDTLKNKSLPRSLTEANVSLILKTGKADDECASYRPISLLNTDLSKILNLCLETVLPFIINNVKQDLLLVRIHAVT